MKTKIRKRKMTNKLEDNKEEEEIVTPIVRGNGDSPQQMALAAQLAKMAEAAKRAIVNEEDSSNS